MKKIRVCSLFSGIGGFESGVLASFGIEKTELVFASEIDPHAVQVFETLYSKKPVGDVTKVSEKDVPEHDLLVGGFPCQPFSQAGLRKGYEDTRGTLFFDIVRIAKEKKPKVVFLENVKGLLSHDKGRTFDVVCNTLSEIGYAVDFGLVNSNLYVPQNRERVYIIAVREGDEEPWELKGPGSVLKAKKQMLKNNPLLKTFNFNFPNQTPTSLNLQQLSDQVVHEKHYLNKNRQEATMKRFNREEWTRLELKATTLSENERLIYQLTEQRSEEGKRIRREFQQKHKRDFSPRRAKEITTRKDNRANCITATTSIEQQVIELPSMRIRSLTPAERWRLQGFSEEQIKTALLSGVSDGQLNKMAGNAVTVDVIKNIANELMPYIEKAISET